MFRSTSLRLSFAFAAIWVVATAAVLGLVFWQTALYIDRSTERVIETDAQGLAEIYNSDGLAGLIDTIRVRVLQATQPDALYLVADPLGRRLVGNVDVARNVVATTGWSTMPLQRDGRATQARLHVGRVREGFVIVVGRDVTERLELRQRIVEALVIALLLGLPAAFLVAWLFRRVVRRRVASIAATAQGIVAGDLAARVPADGSGDEFDALAGTLNAMLERIQLLMDGLRQVSNDVAHDLRTPLAGLRGRLERLAMSAADEPVRDGLAGALGDIDGILRTFESLLRIAAIDAGSQRNAMASFDLVEVMRDIAEIYEPLAEESERSLSVQAPPSLPFHGDRPLIAQALANLVDNALKYGAGPVTIAAVPAGNRVRLSVSDRGPGVPPEERPRVVERFYRREASRAAPGSGLGLALVASVARLHDGRLDLEDHAPGLVAVLDLPARTPMRASARSASAA